MKKLHFLLWAWFIILAATAQDNFSNARIIGTYSSDFDYIDMVDTRTLKNDYGGLSNDAFYRFTITKRMNFYIYLFDAEQGESTALYLLDVGRKQIQSGFNYNDVELSFSLDPGTYYLIAESYTPNVNRTLELDVYARRPLSDLSPTPIRNYIVSLTPTIGLSDADFLASENCLQKIDYYDGLGRLIQTVQRGFAPDGGDLVTGIEYDEMGRQMRQWLPAVTTAGNKGAFYEAYMEKSISDNRDPKAYANSIYEPSPLNRIVAQFGPGLDWETNDRSKRMDYNLNRELEVKIFVVDGDRLACNGYYPPNVLFKKCITDEDGNTSFEFTDKQGQPVMTRQVNANDNHDTYYVFDQLGNKRYVLPPLASDALGGNGNSWDNNHDILRKYAYLYQYDGRRRNIAKRLPGCQWIQMVYDLSDRMILSQDGNQLLKKLWTVNKYDSFGRLLYSGLLPDNNTPDQMRSLYAGTVVTESYNGGSNFGGYTSTLLSPTSLLVVNYYDSYDFLSLLPSDTKAELTSTSQIDTRNSPTGSRSYHLDDPSKFETSAFYYDYYGRLYLTYSTTHRGGYEISLTSLDFRGKPAYVRKTHIKNHAP